MASSIVAVAGSAASDSSIRSFADVATGSSRDGRPTRKIGQSNPDDVADGRWAVYLV
jgi:hypothetical protein